MKSFGDTEKVKVTERGHSLFGKAGRVVRKRMGDNGAWVQMDKPIPEKMTMFSDERRNNVLLFPDQCEPA